MILARLLPGIRTLVAAAAGASAVPYSRFATACGVAALLWAGLWVVGGALIGNALLDVVERYTLPALIVVAAALVLWLGSVAKIVKLEHAWRRLDGRNDDGFQVAPFPG